VIRADRTFLNYVEQAPAFFSSLALFALTVDVRLAGYIALAYSAGRLLYAPFYNTPVLLLSCVTGPNYLEIAGMMITVLYTMFK
jgi:uncharacterized MAPEG superfamily protein